jgi:hypothetical protein
LSSAFTGGGVQLVSVPVDYSENIRVLGRGIAREHRGELTRQLSAQSPFK